MRKPLARRDGLIVEELDGEVLVYDTATHVAHCLNRTAGLVWRWCDGKTAVPELARRLRKAVGPDVDGEALAVGALQRLAKARLIGGSGEEPGPASRSRREALRRLGRAAGAAAVLPVVTTIVAPRAAEAASCIPIGGPCTVSGQCCLNNQNTRCCRNGQCAQGQGPSCQ
jgi:hypothetical protein